MAFVRTLARRMGHGVERADVSLSLRKWWKNAYHHQNGLVSRTLAADQTLACTHMRLGFQR